MNKKNIIVILPVLLLCVICAFTPTNAKEDLKSLSAYLDQIIADKQQFTGPKEQKINNLKNLLNEKGNSQEYEYEINQKLYLEYRKYKLDSAIYYLERNVQIAEMLKGDSLKYISYINLASMYSYAGKIRESEKILAGISARQLPREILPEYYDTYSRFFEHYLAISNQPKYAEQIDLYRDSLLTVLDPSSFRYKIVIVHKYVNQRKIDDAESLLFDLLETEKEYTPEYALITHYLGVVYGMKGKSELEKKYYTMSAIADVRSSLKENASFQRLAFIYYDSGDIARAFRYTQSAIEDAVFSGVQFRTAQMSEFYSIINASYQAQEAKTNSKLKSYILLISFLTLFMVLLVLYIYKQMRKLSVIKDELSSTNAKLTELNTELNKTNDLLNSKNIQLLDSNNIKEQYIAQFFNLCSNYIDKMDENRKTLYKLSSNRQFDVMVKKLKSTSFLDDEIEDLYKQFDSIFLSIYPSFVSEFNDLLLEEERIVLKSDDLLNTELRIYALLRLGITDNTKIASFLRCSMSTVYNYRTKMRNKALVPRNEFENAVMNIGTTNKEEV